jgi:Metallo-peptidase family M12B Reprolysin-like/PEP-CTERM motif
LFIVVGVSVHDAVAIPIDSTVTIQPIRVCDDAGGNCGNPLQRLFEPEGDKIWAQAGIDLVFFGFTEFHGTTFRSLDLASEFTSLVLGAGHGQDPNPSVINMWFVESIPDCGGAAAFGCGFVSANGIAIADSVFTFNGGIGRLDTIAHELGHNLGLGHTDLGAGGPENLMTSGIRLVPASLADIFPDGAQLDQLTGAQIDQARRSTLVATVPEPGTLSLLATGLAGLARFYARRRPAPGRHAKRRKNP